MKKIIVVLLLIGIVFGAGCLQQNGDKTLPDGTIQKTDGTMIKPDGTMIKPDGTMIKPDGTMVEREMMGKNNSMEKTEDSMMTKYSGNVLSGTKAQVIDFNKADYDAAIAGDQIVLLYFYADWCPICKAEVPEMYAAFSELQTDKAVGFRVNFNDGQTDDNERALAQQYGVPYQHTKIIIMNDGTFDKYPDTWGKDRYLTEINSAV